MSGPPVFVVGMPRSGTTLLASLLNGSPELAVSSETDYFPNFWRACERRRCLARPESRRRFVEAWLGSREAARLGLSRDDLAAVRAQLLADDVGHAQILGATLARYASVRGKARWGEKTPAHVLHMGTIQGLFPDALVVQIARDPRDVILSMARVPFGAGNLLRHLSTWRACVRAAPPDAARYRLVRYEDLLADPEGTMRSLAGFLELSFDPAMLHPEATRDRVFDGAAEPWKVKAASAPDPSNAGKWRAAMPARDRRLVARLVGRELSALGYDSDAQPGRWWDILYRGGRRAQNLVWLAAHYALRGAARGRRAVPGLRAPGREETR